MAKLTEKDTLLLNQLLDEYKSIDKDKLSDIQRVILSLNAMDKKSNEDYKSLRAMLKIEKFRLDNTKIISDNLVRLEQLKSDAQWQFTNDLFTAIENQQFIDSLNMTVKQLVLKLIDEKVVSSNPSLKQFLKLVADDNFSNDRLHQPQF